MFCHRSWGDFSGSLGHAKLNSMWCFLDSIELHLLRRATFCFSAQTHGKFWMGWFCFTGVAGKTHCLDGVELTHIAPLFLRCALGQKESTNHQLMPPAY